MKKHDALKLTSSGYYRKFLIGVGGLAGVTAVAGAVLANTTGGVYTGINKASAVTYSDAKSTSASVQVVDSCTLTVTKESTTSAVTVATGTYDDDVKETTIRAVCNDPKGFDIYAVGYSGTADNLDNDPTKTGGGVEGRTYMINAAGDTIATGTNTGSGSDDVSNWAMKIEAEGDSYVPIILNDFDAGFKAVPSEQTKIAAYESVVDSTAGSYFKATYAAYIDYSQKPGTYVGQVKYLLAHPSETTFKTYMQDLDATNIASLLPNVGDTITVYDRRDEQAYIIGKLADNHYWMLDNLKLDLVNVSLDNLKGNTNASDTQLGYLKNGGGSSPNTAYAVSNAWTSSSQNYYDRPMINTSDLTKTDATSSAWGNGSHEYGAYYNYCAASAGTYCYTSGNGSGNATADICPSGWKMPSGDTADGSYYYLYNTGYSANQTNFRNALSTPLSGYFYSGSAGNQGSYGRFWSSTYSSGDSMRGLYVGASNVNPQNGYDRNYGNSVRCILK